MLCNDPGMLSATKVNYWVYLNSCFVKVSSVHCSTGFILFSSSVFPPQVLQCAGGDVN